MAMAEGEAQRGCLCSARPTSQPMTAAETGQATRKPPEAPGEDAESRRARRREAAGRWRQAR